MERLALSYSQMRSRAFSLSYFGYNRQKKKKKFQAINAIYDKDHLYAEVVYLQCVTTVTPLQMSVLGCEWISEKYE